MTVEIHHARFTLRDFCEADRMAFVAYQMDPRYRRLVGRGEAGGSGDALFDRFIRWQTETPRRHYQLGIFECGSGRLCGSTGLRDVDLVQRRAEFGIELAPDFWGRYRLAIDVTSCLLEHGFGALGLNQVHGRTTSGNRRAAKLARWFGAEIVTPRAGADRPAAQAREAVAFRLERQAWSRRQAEHARQPRGSSRK